MVKAINNLGTTQRGVDAIHALIAYYTQKNLRDCLHGKALYPFERMQMVDDITFEQLRLRHHKAAMHSRLEKFKVYYQNGKYTRELYCRYVIREMCWYALRTKVLQPDVAARVLRDYPDFARDVRDWIPAD